MASFLGKLSDQRCSDTDKSGRDIPSFIEPRPPLITNPFMRPRPQKGVNLLEQFEEDSDCEDFDFVRVYLRLKPIEEANTLYEIRDRSLITSVDTAPAGHGRRTQHNVSKKYTFSQVFGPQCNQKEIFEQVVKDNLKKLPDGQSFTLLTYGASGSGKTYTLMGTVNSPGLVPRSLEYVFRIVDAAQHPIYKPTENGAEKLDYMHQEYELQWVKRLRQVSAPLRDKYRRMSTQLRNETRSCLDISNRVRHYLWVSFVEIYNEGIYDLLVSGDRHNPSSKLQIREDSSGHVYVKGATYAFVRSGEEAYDVMVAGKHNLQVAATGMNAHSSRSHCIFTITMLTETESGVRWSAVRLCDLAGCERAARVGGARLRESRAINASLHVLERCLHALRRRRRAPTLVPYRESKLTRLLGAGLSGGRGEAVGMVVTLNPARAHAAETKHVLQLAAVAKDIQVNSTIDEMSSLETTQDSTTDGSVEVMRLKSDNERLHFELLQSQNRNRELLASMEEKQQQAASTMWELVQEAKDMTREYYERQLQALRDEMDAMREEYESNAAEKAPPTNFGTPSKLLQDKVQKLMREIAILEEKLAAEQLARECAEEEVRHLRACIEERDEKIFDERPRKDVIDLCDSEHESDQETEEPDPCNESLEPSFRKEDINRSRLLKQSFNHQASLDNTTNQDDSDNKSDESVLEKSSDTVKDNEKTYDNCNDFSDNTGAECETDASDITRDSAVNFSNGSTIDNLNLVSNGMSISDTTKTQNFVARGTYFVKDTEKYKIELNLKSKLFTEDYCIAHIDSSNISSSVSDVAIDNESSFDSPNNSEGGSHFSENQNLDTCKKVKPANKLKSTSTDKLLEFEQLETDANAYTEERKSNNAFGDIKSLSENRQYFDAVNKETSNEKEHILHDVKEPILHEATDTITCVTKYSPNLKLDSAITLATSKVEEIKIKDNEGSELTEEISKDKKSTDSVFDMCVPKLKTFNAPVFYLKLPNDERSPSIVKDVAAENFEPSTIKRLLGESFTRQTDYTTSVKKSGLDKIKHDSLDMFQSPLIEGEGKLDNGTEFVCKPVDSLVLDGKSEIRARLESTKKLMGKLFSDKIHVNIPENREVVSIIGNKKEADVTQLSETKVSSKEDNTIDEFEQIYNDITAPRPTEFEELVSHNCTKTEVYTSNKALEDTSTKSTEDFSTKSTNDTATISTEDNSTKSTEDISTKSTNGTSTKSTNDTSTKSTEDNSTKSTNDTATRSTEDNSTKSTEDVKYNLRNKSHPKTEDKNANAGEILMESEAKCASTKRPRRTLRLRKQKNLDEVNEDFEKPEKLKDIMNLQQEFSDLTMDVPAPKREVKMDIPSPEKSSETENLPPVTQSCPSKSVTRSRRKLFTPRAEPLDESLPQAGDSNERIRVPRPSYHRAQRARRKL